MSPQKKGYFDEYENLNFHPYNILLILLLFGISALFLALSAAYIYNRVQAQLPPLHLPLIFIFNTLLLLASSYTLHQAQKAFKTANLNQYKRYIRITLLLSISFLLLQIVGWYQLFSDSYYLGKDNATSYLYLISAVHFAHVIFGLPFLAKFYFSSRRKTSSPVTHLVYFSDPTKKLTLRLLTIYWHFLDALWVYLVFFFGLNVFLS